MNCNCINNAGQNETGPKIRGVFGNVLRLAIPLTLRTIEIVDEEVQVTDTPFVPSGSYPVLVVLYKGKTDKIELAATMRDGNVAYVEDKGTIPVGTYSVEVLCKDDNGNPYRFKQANQVSVVDATRDAGITTPIEFESGVWYLDAAIYLALKGEDGVGIEDIVTETSDDVGGVNTITIVLTDGTSRSFTILNGSGSVDRAFSATSQHPLANYVVTARFNLVDEALAGLFGDVTYENRLIKFWNKDKTTLIATLDATPFVKDAVVSNVYLSNNTLVVSFNSDSGRSPINIPLTGLFNLSNYYDKNAIDTMFTTNLSGVVFTEPDGKIPFVDSAPVVLDGLDYFFDYSSEAPTITKDMIGKVYGMPYDSTNKIVRFVWLNTGYSMQMSAIISDASTNLIYFNKDDGKFYTFTIYDTESGDGYFEEIEIEGSGGGGSGTVTAIKMNNGSPISPDSNGVVNLGTVITSHQDISGKAEKSEMSVTDGTGANADKIIIQLKSGTTATVLKSHQDISGKVDKTTTVNGKPLSGNVTLGASDVGALPSSTTIPNNGIASITSQQDGSIVITLSNGDSYTINFNHTHPDKQDVLTAGTGITISNGVISATGGSGSQVQADWDESDSSDPAYIKNKPTIPTIPTNVSSFTNDAGYLTSHQSLSGYLKYYLCTDETEYNSITNKDSGTLYLIPESNA